jgi:hypothetical protein
VERDPSAWPHCSVRIAWPPKRPDILCAYRCQRELRLSLSIYFRGSARPTLISDFCLQGLRFMLRSQSTTVRLFRSR